ncbi:MAG TPA: hypothetical protein VFB39_00855 [Solirubrobacteraceae bacterium]|jgi:hypothetical protein|nr:hypothetical protein [Solirubrobacteraceae bacterium]
MESHRPAGSPGSRSPITGADAAKAGMLMLTVNCLCAGIGAAVGAAIGAIVPLALVGFFVGFGVAIAFVIRRYSAR